MSSIPLYFKPFGVRIEFDNIECTSDKKEPFEVDVPIKKTDMFMYLCEKQSDFKPENILKNYFEIKRKTMGFYNPFIYYYRFYIAIDAKKTEDNNLIPSWKEVNLDFFEYFLGIRYNSYDYDFVIKPEYVYF